MQHAGEGSRPAMVWCRSLFLCACASLMGDWIVQSFVHKGVGFLLQILFGGS